VNYAHQRGVIHRDLKPGNILVDAAGRPHVCDFGLAKTIIDSDDPAMRSMSMTGQFMGSLPWASPEQLEAAPGVDVRTDVYSLGVVLYQILTGRFPYDVSGGIRKLFDNISRVEPVRPSAITRHLDDEIDTIVMKCLAKTHGGIKGGPSWSMISTTIWPANPSRRNVWRYALRKHFIAIGDRVGHGRHPDRSDSCWCPPFVRDATAPAMGPARNREHAAMALSRAHDDFRRPRRDGRDVRFMDVLDKAAAELGTTLRDQPRVEAEVRRTLGSTYAALGKYEAAEKQLQAARTIASRVLGPRHRTTLELVAATPEIIAARGRLDEAEQQARSALAEIRGTLGENDVLTCV
jgi:hypothetical protein